MAATNATFTLNTGAQIPVIGLGTWHAAPDDAREAVKAALKLGYRHIDTAQAYKNEKEVGEGIKESGIPRDQIWVTTKLDHRWHHRVAEAVDQSLEVMGLDYFDLYLMHWPCSTDPDDTTKHLTDWNFLKTWQEMMKLPETGKVKNIGVCNVQLQNLEKLLNDPACTTVPAVNQIELHPNHPSTKLLEVCRSKDIHVTAYCPLGSTGSRLMAGDEPILNKISEAKGKTHAQVLLRWGIQRGTSVVPKSITPSRIESNLEVQGWELSSEEMEELSSLEDRFKVCGDGFLPIRVFFDDDE